MKAHVWFRIAAVLLVLFAVGHTFGFLTFQPSTVEGRAVWTDMNSVNIGTAQKPFTYGGFYVGFGLFITTFYLFASSVAWTVGCMASKGTPYARHLAWSLCGLQTLGFVLSLRFFSAPPAILSALTAILLAIGAWSIRTASSTLQH